MASKYKTGYLQRLSNPINQLDDQNEELEAESQESTPENTTNAELRRAIASPKTLSSNAVMTIQRSYGNQAALRMIQRSREEASQTIQRVPTPRIDTNFLTTNPELTSFLTKPERIPTFKKFLLKEFSYENFLAFHAVRHFIKNPTLNEAQEIFDTYVKVGAEFEANLASNVYKEVEQILQDPNFDQRVMPVFTHLTEALITNLLDSFSRFELSEEYEEWKSIQYNPFKRIAAHKQGMKDKREGHAGKLTKYSGGAINI